MKYIIDKSTVEPTISVELEIAESGNIEIVGRKAAEGLPWVIGTLLTDGKFQPNKAGCRQLGLTIDNRFNQ